MGVDFGVGKLFSNGIDLELNGSFGGKSYKETIPRIMDISFLKMVVVVSLMEDLRLMINVSLLQKIGLIGHLLGLLNFWLRCCVIRGSMSSFDRNQSWDMGFSTM
jgi:hypothetical protein